MHLRCPHCHNPIDVLNDQPLHDVCCPSCGSSFSLISGGATQSLHEVGRALGHFQLIEQLGAGHFGTVWKARDTELDRVVAIKIPRKDQLTDADTELFFREARAAAQLRHPNIVSVHEVGRDGDAIYIASDYIEGCNLKEWLSAQKLTFRESAELCVTIANALHHAHESGVVHRDLKPGNILMGVGQAFQPDPDAQHGVASQPASKNVRLESLTYTPYLTDFGLAKRESGEITMTVEGQILGTPAYMSPEQARGQGHQADRRSDIYSLGVILFELLTGELPFRGETRMLIVQILRDEPPSPRKLNARIPRDLETITLKCLSKDPARRYATAAEVAADLHRYIRGEPILARPVSQAERLVRWSRRNPVVALLTTAIGLVLFVGIVVASYFAVEAKFEANRYLREWNRANEKEREASANANRATANAREASANAERANEQTAAATSALAEAARQSQLAARHLYATHMNLAQRNFEHGDTQGTVELLQRYAPGSPKENLRGFEWFYWNRACHGEIRTMKGQNKSAAMSIAFSPDGARIASASNNYEKKDFTVEIWDVATGNVAMTLKGHEFFVGSVAFSPDGKRIASGDLSGVLKVWDTTDGKETASWNTQTNVRFDFSVAFSPNGKWIASLGGEGGPPKVWEAATGQEATRLTGNKVPHRLHGTAFSPDSARIASGDTDGTLTVWDIATGQETTTLKCQHYGEVMTVAYSPDGARLAAANYSSIQPDHGVTVWDTATGQRTATLKGHRSWVRSVTFSPDSSQIASASDDQTVKLWDAASGQEIVTLKGHTSGVRSVAYSPDGSRIASASDDLTVKLWNVATGESPWRQVSQQNGIRFGEDLFQVWKTANRHKTLSLTGPTFMSRYYSPDGTRELGTERDGSWALRVGGKNEQIATLKGHTDWIHNVRFSPDSARFASASADKTMKLWDAVTGKELMTLQGHTAAVNCVTFDPEGKRMASASADKTVKLWDAATGGEITTLKGHKASVGIVAFSPDGARLASWSNDGMVKFWVAATGKETLTLNGLEESFEGYTFEFSADGKWIASVSQFDEGPLGNVKVWDAVTGKQTATLKGHTSQVFRVAFSPDSQRIASGSLDGTVKLWDVATGQETLTIKAHSECVTRLAFSPDGTRLISDDEAFGVKFWDARQWTPELITEREASGLLTFLRDHRIRSENQVRDWIQTTPTINDAVRKAALGMLPDLKFPKVPKLAGHEGLVNWVEFPKSSRQLMSAGWDGMDATVRLWNLQTGSSKVIGEVGKYARGIYAFAVSPDGRRLAICCGDQTVRVIDPQSGVELRSLVFEKDPAERFAPAVKAVRFHPNGSTLVAGDTSGMIRVWDVTTGKELRKITESKAWTHGTQAIVLTADGQQIVGPGSEKTVKFWDLETGNEIKSFDGFDHSAMAVSVSPNGQRMASVHQDGAVELWDLRTRTKKTLGRHSGITTAVSFSLDSQRLVTVGGVAKVWNVENGTLWKTLQVDKPGVHYAAFSPDGKQVATAGGGGILLWDVDEDGN